MRKIFDANGREIHIGDRVRFATWGMFDIWIKDEEKSGIKDTDPKYVTHVEFGTVEGLLEGGDLYIRPDGINGVWHICTTPTWGARPEFIEIINN